MTTDLNLIIKDVLAVYAKATGSDPKLAVWERRLFDYAKAGFTAEDMACVVGWIKRQNKINNYQKSLSLLKLMDLENFDACLCEARAWERNHKVFSARERVLQQFRGYSERDTRIAAQRVGAVINQMKERG